MCLIVKSRLILTSGLPRNDAAGLGGRSGDAPGGGGGAIPAGPEDTDGKAPGAPGWAAAADGGGMGGGGRPTLAKNLESNSRLNRSALLPPPVAAAAGEPPMAGEAAAPTGAATVAAVVGVEGGLKV